MGLCYCCLGWESVGVQPLPHCTEAYCGLAFACHGLDVKRQEMLNWEIGDTVVEFVN